MTVSRLQNNVNIMEGDDRYPGPNGNKFNVDDLLQSLMKSSASATDSADLNDMDSIAGEYTSLNNTIDELNKFLDVWDERHDRLRSEIKEALEEASSSNNEIAGADSAEVPTSELTVEETVSEKKTDESSNNSQPEKSVIDNDS